jgi:pyridoxine 5-phosphate synthase
MPRLSVNIDHIATLRQARGGGEPDPLWAAMLAEKAGAHGIIAHLREDRRHIQDNDVRLLSQVVKGHFNLEMAAVEEMAAIALELRPAICTLVPEKRQELTTEGGLQVHEQSESIAKIIKQLQTGGITVSLFIDPHPAQLRAAHLCGAQMVELHTGSYANAKGRETEKELGSLMDAARLASKLGLKVAAGHGLSLQNIPPLLEIEEIEDYSIGHSIVARAVFTGFEAAVKEMLELLNRPPAPPRRESPPSPPSYRLRS